MYDQQIALALKLARRAHAQVAMKVQILHILNTTAALLDTSLADHPMLIPADWSGTNITLRTCAEHSAELGTTTLIVNIALRGTAPVLVLWLGKDKPIKLLNYDGETLEA